MGTSGSCPSGNCISKALSSLGNVVEAAPDATNTAPSIAVAALPPCRPRYFSHWSLI